MLTLKASAFSRLLVWIVLTCFCGTMVITPSRAAAAPLLGLPEPGTMVSLSASFNPVMLKGLKIDPKNPLIVDFIVSQGQEPSSLDAIKEESLRQIKYFLASMAIPDEDMWVNLSPYEKNRIIPEALGQTELGRDMLAQDYVLKQMTASLIYPEKELGKIFWDKVYTKARQMYGTSQVPVNTFNKVWIVADKAKVFEHQQTVFVVSSHLKVMLEEDYIALSRHPEPQAKDLNKSNDSSATPQNDPHTIASHIVKDIILPELEKEVNEGKNFANLRQIYNGMILAVWFKSHLKQSFLTQVYANSNKVSGVGVNDGVIASNPLNPEQIYQMYLKAYRKGVFNYIKEESDSLSSPNASVGDLNRTTIPRKYFSGGLEVVQARNIVPAMRSEFSAAMRSEPGLFNVHSSFAMASDVGRKKNALFSQEVIEKLRADEIDMLMNLHDRAVQGSKVAALQIGTELTRLRDKDKNIAYNGKRFEVSNPAMNGDEEATEEEPVADAASISSEVDFLHRYTPPNLPDPNFNDVIAGTDWGVLRNAEQRLRAKLGSSAHIPLPAEFEDKTQDEHVQEMIASAAKFLSVKGADIDVRVRIIPDEMADMVDYGYVLATGGDKVIYVTNSFFSSIKDDKKTHNKFGFIARKIIYLNSYKSRIDPIAREMEMKYAEKEFKTEVNLLFQKGTQTQPDALHEVLHKIKEAVLLADYPMPHENWTSKQKREYENMVRTRQDLYLIYLERKINSDFGEGEEIDPFRDILNVGLDDDQMIERVSRKVRGEDSRFEVVVKNPDDKDIEKSLREAKMRIRQEYAADVAAAKAKGEAHKIKRAKEVRLVLRPREDVVEVNKNVYELARQAVALIGTNALDGIAKYNKTNTQDFKSMEGLIKMMQFSSKFNPITVAHLFVTMLYAYAISGSDLYLANVSQVDPTKPNVGHSFSDRLALAKKEIAGIFGDMVSVMVNTENIKIWNGEEIAIIFGALMVSLPGGKRHFYGYPAGGDHFYIWAPFDPSKDKKPMIQFQPVNEKTRKYYLFWAGLEDGEAYGLDWREYQRLIFLQQEMYKQEKMQIKNKGVLGSGVRGFYDDDINLLGKKNPNKNPQDIMPERKAIIEAILGAKTREDFEQVMKGATILPKLDTAGKFILAGKSSKLQHVQYVLFHTMRAGENKGDVLRDVLSTGGFSSDTVRRYEHAPWVNSIWDSVHQPVPELSFLHVRGVPGPIAATRTRKALRNSLFGISDYNDWGGASVPLIGELLREPGHESMNHILGQDGMNLPASTQRLMGDLRFEEEKALARLNDQVGEDLTITDASNHIRYLGQNIVGDDVVFKHELESFGFLPTLINNGLAAINPTSDRVVDLAGNLKDEDFVTRMKQFFPDDEDGKESTIFAVLERSRNPYSSIQISKDQDLRLEVSYQVELYVDEEGELRNRLLIRDIVGDKNGDNYKAVRKYLEQINNIEDMSDRSVSKAMFSPTEQRAAPTGGIDLNSKNLDLQSEGDGVDISFDPAMIEQFKKGDFAGIVPVIINVTPIPNIMPFIGLKEEDNLQLAEV